MTDHIPPHAEDPGIERLAEEAGRTDERAVGRRLFGVREVVSLLVPLILLGLFARNVDWAEAAHTIGRANPFFVLLALAIYYVAFPLRAWRWALLLREGGASVRGMQLLRIRKMPESRARAMDQRPMGSAANASR